MMKSILLIFGIFIIITVMAYKLSVYSRNDNKMDLVLLDESVKAKLNLNELFHIGECLLKRSGEAIVDIRNKDIDATNKKDESIVTKADYASNAIIVDTLKFKYSNKLNVISEEISDEPFDMEAIESHLGECDNYIVQPSTDTFIDFINVNVWIDPLDATQEYSGFYLVIHYLNLVLRINFLKSIHLRKFN
jgi:hypothetical protein